MSVDSYIVSLDWDRRKYIERWHYLITQAAPLLDVKMWDYQGDLIGYGTYHYKTKSGLEGDWFSIGLASRKNYISIYTMAVKDGSYLTEKYLSKFPKGTKAGVSCINVYKPEDVEEQVITDLVKESLPLLEGLKAEPEK